MQRFVENFLIEKVGRFVDGMTKENIDLGIWGGNLVLKNLKLKPELLVRPAIPFKFVFIHIGQLTLNFPWTKLSSESVQIAVEDIYVVVTPLDPAAWEAVAEYDALRRVRELETFITHYLSKVTQKEKKAEPQKEQVTKVSMPKNNNEEKKDDDNMDEKSEGFFAKIATKVRENIKLTISNCHIRLESKTHKFSGGFTFEEFKAFPINQKGEPGFTDSTNPENRRKPIYRSNSTKNASIYWNANTEDLISELPLDQRHRRMRDLIIKEGAGVDEATNYISSSSVGVVSSRNKHSGDEPFVNITVTLKPFDLLLTLPQLESMKKFFDHMKAYTEFLKERAQKLKEVLNLQFPEKEMIDEYVPRFKKILLKALPLREKVIKESKKVKENILLSCMDSTDFKRVNLFLNTLPRRYFSWAAKEAVKVYEKERRIRALKETKESSGKIFFGLVSFKKDQENLITSEDVINIEADITRRLEKPEWNVHAHEKKERAVMIMNVRNGGMNLKYYEDSEKQKELGNLRLNNFEENLRVTLQGRNLYFSRRFYNMFFEFNVVTEDKSITEQISTFMEVFRKNPFPIEILENLIKEKGCANSVVINEKGILNKITFNPFYYENYKKEEDTIDERPLTSKKPDGDDDEIPFADGDDEEDANYQ